MIPPHLLEQVKLATNLQTLAPHYLNVKRTGQRVVALCPFHKEKTPSLSIHPTYFYCFGCGANGSAFDFLVRMERIPFPEAVQRLADSAGISLDSKPVSRAAMVYAREEADLCLWWWEKRSQAIASLISQSLQADASEEKLNWLSSVSVHFRQMPPSEKFQRFRRSVTAQDRQDWLDEQRSVEAFKRVWLSLAGR